MEASRSKDFVILVGHGGVPSDIPSGLVAELKQLEGRRRASRVQSPDSREVELDRQIRDWPRTEKTDPYRSGLESIAVALAQKLGERPLLLAYNEFCSPSLPDAIAEAVTAGAASITIAPTMFTPGGSHSDVEIPEILDAARAQYPTVSIRYVWPFDLEQVADFLARHISDS